MKKNFLLISSIAIALFFAACGGDSEAKASSTKSIKLSKESLKIISGNPVELTATVEPSDSESEITWTVNEETAELTLSTTTGSTVTITGGGINNSDVNNLFGEAVVTATSNGHSASCSVLVLKDESVVLPDSISLSETTFSVDLTEESPTLTKKVTATVNAPNGKPLSDGADKVTWTSSDETVATVSAETGATVTVTATKKAGTATITATTINGKTAEMTVTASSNVIKASDTPNYFASLGAGYVTSGTATTVSSKSELLTAINNGGLIYVNGMIDMTDGMLPTEGGGSTTGLDSFVNTITSGKYTTYSAWKTAYATACKLTTEDGDSNSTAKSDLYDTLWKLNHAWKNNTGSYVSNWKGIQITISKPTTIIGLTNESGIKGGAIVITGSGVILRNLTIQDAYDPFPHHEVKDDGSSDGYNAQFDCICIQDGGKNVWIDHCTLKDTMTLVHVNTNGSSDEKWQTYDGLLDMKGKADNITVSYCKFMNHDKTMLIGSSDSEKVNGTAIVNTDRHITLANNYFYNCGQRLPMVRLTTIHILNNLYDKDSNAPYSQQYAIGNRKNALIYSEANYFGSGITYAFKDDYGTVYDTGSAYTSSQKKSTLASSAPFTPSSSYTYTPLSASDAKADVIANAGAGKWLVKQ